MVIENLKISRGLRFLLSILWILALALPPSLTQAVTAPPEIPIRLQHAVFDPLLSVPEIPTAYRLEVEADEASTYLVQFVGPVRPAWKAAVTTKGARLYGYVPDFAFIARMDTEAAEQIEALSFVRWVGLFHPAYRLASALQEVGDSAQVSEAVTVTVQTLPDTDFDMLETRVRTWDGSVQGQAINDIAGYLQVDVGADRLDDLATLEGVLWVEPYFEPELHNDVGGSTIMRADELRADVGLYGQGQIVAVADSGLDTGNASTLHEDVRGRLVQPYALGRPDDWSDPNGHGTHVVGSVLGNGSMSGSDLASHDYTNSYAGLAPEAQLVFQSLGDAQGGLGGIPEDRGDLMRVAYDHGARVHTNSWGGPTGGTWQDPEYGGYVLSSQQVDQVMWERPDMLILYSAGNSGVDAAKDGRVDPDSVGQPGTAKNVLTVGASENARESIAATWGDSYGAPIATDRRANDSDGLAAFSSRGPTDDGRIKPDLVAPGTYVASLRTRQYAFVDDMEAAETPDAYTLLSLNGGTGDTWQWVVGDAHSPNHHWQAGVKGVYNPGAMSILLTPVMNVQPTGGFDLVFWQRYELRGDNELVLLLTDNDLSPQFWVTLDASDSQSAYQPFLLSLPTSLCDQACLDPTQLAVGFAIHSASGNYDSRWWLDDVRTEGSDWGTMSSVGLAQPGDAIDEAYVMMGGTSMATPLTAGAVALVREWYNDHGIVNPSGALMKATLINGAADMSPGQYGANGSQEVPAQRPNNVSGWGRVDLVESLNPPDPRTIWFTDQTTGLSTGESAIYTLTVGSMSGGMGTGATTKKQVDITRAASLPGYAPDYHDATAASSNLDDANRLLQDETSQLLQNPGFDTGVLSPWIPLGNPLLTYDVYRSASYSAWLAGYDDAEDLIYQSVSVPSDATEATLDYWFQVNSEEIVAGRDWFCYDITDSEGYTLIAGSYCWDLSEMNQDQWLNDQHVLSGEDLAPLLGETVRVWFFAQTDSSGTSDVWVDDTAFNVTAGSEVPPTLAIMPASGPRGTTFTVSGSDFNADDTVTIAIDGTDSFDISSDGSGVFSFNMKPDGTETKGVHTVTATDSGGQSAEDTYEIVPQVNLTVAPSTGQPGDTFTITGSGFHGGSAITVTLDGGVNGTTTADASGAFTYTLNTEVGITVGSHTVRATDDEASTASDTLSITAAGTRQVSIAPNSGPNGTRFNVVGTDFSASTVVTLTVDGDFVKTVDADGNGDFSITYIPTDLSESQHRLNASDGKGDAEATFTITPPSQTGGPLRVTLAWTDYPGEPGAAKALVNDLDLEIIGPDGTHYYGNQDSTSGQCLRESKWDTCNNVEGFIISEAPKGTYTIIVHGYNIPQGPQPFALVVAGDHLQAGDVPTSDRRLSINPRQGVNGAPFTITGYNFTSNADVFLKVGDEMIETVRAQENGAFSTTYTSTDLHAGQHTLTASDGEGQAETTFTIIATTGYTVYLPLLLR